MDLIDRQAAIDTILSLTYCSTVRELYEYIQEHQLTNTWIDGINDAIDAVIGVPSAEPERKIGTDNGCTFLTCKHGGFGDDTCSKCRWAYRDMYEADEKGAQDG